MDPWNILHQHSVDVFIVVIEQSSEEDGWTMLRMENDELLRRLTELQQQSWMLEEKVFLSGHFYGIIVYFCLCFAAILFSHIST